MKARAEQDPARTTQAVEAAVLRESARGLVEAAAPDIEVVLVASGLIGVLQLQAARAHQRQWGRSLEQALVELGFLSAEILLATRAELVGVEFIRIGDRRISRDVLQRVPARLAHSRRILPIELVDARRGSLLVAMAHPQDLSVVDEIAFAAGTPVQAALAAGGDLDRAIARHYPRPPARP